MPNQYAGQVKSLTRGAYSPGGSVRKKAQPKRVGEQFHKTHKDPYASVRKGR